MRPTVARLSTKNLIHNVYTIKSLAPNSKLIAMVKANAYGHGIRSIATRIDDIIDGFGVSSIDEALILRKVNIKSDIILAEGVFSQDEITIASENNFQIAINNFEQIKFLESIMHLKNKLKIWIKIDTGMNRLGFKTDNQKQIEDIFITLKKNQLIDQEIVLMSHFACSDILDHPLTKKQIDNYETIVQLLENKGFKIKKSLCNSAAIVSLPKHHYDIVRTGIMMYGISPLSNQKPETFNLKPVMQLETKILTTKIAKKGESIGYGADYICETDIKIGIIPIGYGDGYSRTFKTGTPVLVNDKICSVIGRISMDMTIINLTNCPDCKNGDQVILFGYKLPIDEITKHSNCIPIDLLTGIQHRVKFEWI
jgi:alanine racemase